VFDPGQVAREHRGPDSDRLTIAQLTGTARRHARWGALAADQKVAAVTPEGGGIACRRCGQVTEDQAVIYGRDDFGALVAKAAQCRGPAVSPCCRAWFGKLQPEW
jgi:hypothetical protein